MVRMLMLLTGLVLLLTGCSLGAKSAPFGVMPPIVPAVDGAPSAAPSTEASDVAAWPEAANGAGMLAASGEMTLAQHLDTLWADHEWESVILLLEEERGNPDAGLDAATITEKLYAARINAGYAALQLNRKDEAMTHFLAAMALAPDRGESEPGLVMVQNRYIDEAKQILQELERQHAERQQQPLPQQE